MEPLALILGFAIPPVLLVAGLFLLGLSMPSARGALHRRGWIAPVTLALIVPGSLVLLFLLAWRGDSETSTWADAGGDVRAVWVAALALGAAASAAQWWVMIRDEHGVTPRLRSGGTALAGVAMLVLFAALLVAWLASLG